MSETTVEATETAAEDTEESSDRLPADHPLEADVVLAPVEDAQHRGRQR